MKFRLLITILTCTILFDTGCGVESTDMKVAKNDTTNILKILLDSAFYRQRLPNFSNLKLNNPFGDTIIFKFDSILVGNLPTDLKFKLLTQDQICSLATQSYNNQKSFCNFLELNNFQKTDTTYKVRMETHCLEVVVDRIGKATCLTEKYCNGGIEMTFFIRADSLKSEPASFWDY